MSATEQLPLVLVVDDDPTVRELLEDYLGEEACRVQTARDGRSARAAIEREVPDAVLLDIGLPGEDGLSLARFLREHHDIGIIILSGAGSTVDRIVGLEVGADDYLAKPFDLRELRARLKSVLRRYQRHAADGVQATASTRRVSFGAAVLDLDTRQLFDPQGHEVPLTSAEYDLLRIFAERPNRPMTRDQLMMLTRNRDWDPSDRTIDIQIARLRKKIEGEGDQPHALKTVRGVGYMFVPPP